MTLIAITIAGRDASKLLILYVTDNVFILWVDHK